MNWNKWVRQIHRWLSIAFTFGVIINGFNVAGGRPAYWVYFLALVPLFLLLFTGLYLFALPYVGKWRGGALLRADQPIYRSDDAGGSAARAGSAEDA